MATSPLKSELKSTEATWHEIDEVIESISRLAKTEDSSRAFYTTVVERLVSALAGQGGAIWTLSGGHLQQECLVSPPNAWIVQNTAGLPKHSDMVERVVKLGQPRLIQPHRKPTASDPALNPTDSLIVLYPWCVDEVPVGLIELFQRAGAGPKVEQGYLKFLEVIAEIAAEFHRNCQLRQYKKVAQTWGRFNQFAKEIHASLDLRKTAYTIVNEGRRFLECDRVSLLMRRARSYRLAAVSGVDKVNRRAELSRRLERLARAVGKTTDPLWFPETESEHPPELEKVLSELLDNAHSRSVGVMPLMNGNGKRERPIAILVVERFFGTLGPRDKAMIAESSVHAATALKNCQDLASVPFLPVLRGLRSAVRLAQLSKALLLLGACAAVVAAAMLIPADFNIVADGELMPVRLRDVFARADGTVSNLCVEHGQHVHAGDLLAILRRPQLDLEFKQVLGELQTAQQKLISLEAERLQASRDSEAERHRYSNATAQEEELHETIRSLRSQYDVLKSKQTENEVRSPMDGDVLTWNVHQLLDDRPVSRGQVLLTIGDLAGPWKLELHVPDRQAGHVRSAQDAQSGKPLEVAYVLAMNPKQRFRGSLSQLGMRSEANERDGSFVLATIDIDGTKLDQRVAGAGVRAYIECGRRSVGYVWLHDLIDLIRTKLLF